MIRTIEISIYDSYPEIYEPTIVLMNHPSRSDWRYCRFCDTGQKERDPVFSINREGTSGLYYWNDLASHYRTIEQATSKELFFDALKEKHPEFAEWLLFHSEWL